MDREAPDTILALQIARGAGRGEIVTCGSPGKDLIP